MDEQFIRRMAFKHPPDFSRYPFSLPAVRELEKIQFDRPVTFLMGENGTGKSTVLNIIAQKLHLKFQLFQPGYPLQPLPGDHFNQRLSPSPGRLFPPGRELLQRRQLH